MSYIRFNRHKIFNERLMDYHSQTISKIDHWSYSHSESINTHSIDNMLAGIWDGYLYSTLLPEAIVLGIPKKYIRRIEYTIEKIMDTVVVEGESITTV